MCEILRIHRTASQISSLIIWSSWSRERREITHTYKSEIITDVMKTVKENTTWCNTTKELEGLTV